MAFFGTMQPAMGAALRFALAFSFVGAAAAVAGVGADAAGGRVGAWITSTVVVCVAFTDASTRSRQSSSVRVLLRA